MNPLREQGPSVYGTSKQGIQPGEGCSEVTFLNSEVPVELVPFREREITGGRKGLGLSGAGEFIVSMKGCCKPQHPMSTPKQLDMQFWLG